MAPPPASARWPSRRSASGSASALRGAPPRAAAARPCLVPLDHAHEVAHEPSDEAHRADRPRVVHASRTDDPDVADHARRSAAVATEYEAAVEQWLDAVHGADRHM